MSAQQTLQSALQDVDRALSLDEGNGPAHCTKGEILKQMALIVADGATDKSAAAAAGSESEKEWTRLIHAAIAAQRAAIRLEPDAEEPRGYLIELLAMAGIEEEVEDVRDMQDWVSSTRSIPAPQSEKGGEPRSKEGWLHKKGGLKDGERNWVKGGKRNWKARWVALDGNGIRWYDLKGGKELGKVELSVFDRLELDADKCVILLPLTAVCGAEQCVVAQHAPSISASSCAGVGPGLIYSDVLCAVVFATSLALSACSMSRYVCFACFCRQCKQVLLEDAQQRFVAEGRRRTSGIRVGGLNCR